MLSQVLNYTSFNNSEFRIFITINQIGHKIQLIFEIYGFHHKQFPRNTTNNYVTTIPRDLFNTNIFQTKV